MSIIFIIGFFIVLLLLFRSIFSVVFSINNISNHKKRMKQLKFDRNGGVIENDGPDEFINKITTPVIRHILPKFSEKNMDFIEKKLKITRWDRFFTPIQWRAFVILMRMIAIIVLFILSFVSIPLAIIWFIPFFFGPSVALNVETNNKRLQILSGFPDFIRVTEGYLSAGYTFIDAVIATIPYVDKHWEPILQKFVATATLNNINEALEMLKNDVEIFEVKEFVSLVRLTLENGGDAKESFTAQADKVHQIHLDIMEGKISKRKAYVTALNAPILISIIVVFGLPVFYSILTFSSM